MPVDLSPADLNLLYDAALEFGENWRRPLSEFAVERLPDRDAAYRRQLVKAVETCRAEIEDYVASVFTLDETAGVAMSDASVWVSEHYPWMTPQNVGQGVSQGGYYAWHG